MPIQSTTEKHIDVSGDELLALQTLVLIAERAIAAARQTFPNNQDRQAQHLGLTTMQFLSLEYTTQICRAVES